MTGSSPERVTEKSLNRIAAAVGPQERIQAYLNFRWKLKRNSNLAILRFQVLTYCRQEHLRGFLVAMNLPKNHDVGIKTGYIKGSSRGVTNILVERSSA